MGQADIGMHGPGIDPEGTGGHIFIMFGLGMDKEGEGAGIAHQHALAALEQGKGVGADAVPQAHGLHAGDDGFLQFLASLGDLALGHDGLEVGQGLGQDHDAVHAALQDAGGQTGLFQAARLGQHVVGLGQQVLHGDDLPAPGQAGGLTGLEAGQQGLLVGLGVQRHAGHVLAGPDGAAGKGGHVLHPGAGHDDPVHTGFQGQGHVGLAERFATVIDAGHAIPPRWPGLLPPWRSHARWRAGHARAGCGWDAGTRCGPWRCPRRRP